MIVAPERSVEQRMAALKVANEVRSRKAELKRELRENRMLILKAICDPPVWLRNAKVEEILLATRGFGRVKVREMLRAAEIAPSKTVGGITDRQRVLLLRRLRDRL